MNEWKRLLAEIKNIKLNTNNNIKQYIHQRCYQVTNNLLLLVNTFWFTFTSSRIIYFIFFYFHFIQFSALDSISHVPHPRDHQSTPLLWSLQSTRHDGTLSTIHWAYACSTGLRRPDTIQTVCTGLQRTAVWCVSHLGASKLVFGYYEM